VYIKSEGGVPMKHRLAPLPGVWGGAPNRKGVREYYLRNFFKAIYILGAF
jgi:hypothetical protein